MDKLLEFFNDFFAGPSPPESERAGVRAEGGQDRRRPVLDS